MSSFREKQVVLGGFVLLGPVCDLHCCCPVGSCSCRDCTQRCLRTGACMCGVCGVCGLCGVWCVCTHM